MAKRALWHDDYWLMLMHAYLQKPVGVKPLYSPIMVELSLELHIPPQQLRKRMIQIASLDTPRIERIWSNYSANPGRLARAVGLLRSMKGFGQADEFYDGVDMQESFERDFRPLPEDPKMMPAMLIMILNLYFQLTPATMVKSTPEVRELARLIKLKADDVVQVLNLFQLCDPYLERNEVTMSPLLLPCQQVWQRMADKEPQQLQALADELKIYFQSKS